MLSHNDLLAGYISIKKEIVYHTNKENISKARQLKEILTHYAAELKERGVVFEQRH